MLFSDRLEVANPGGLPQSLTLESLRQPHSSVPRNPMIAESLYLTQYIERMGTGTGDMIRLCREAGLPEPEFSIRGGFLTTIWRRSKDKVVEKQDVVSKPSGITSGKTSGKTSGIRARTTASAIIELMRNNQMITIPEIAEKLNKTERAIQMQISKLQALELIARIGPAKGGHWEVLK
jgi:predicted HTH transcriptional regulator